jgi:ATP-dependent RNA helicase RhlE
VAFATLGLDPRLLKGLGDRGFEHTTPIQREAVPIVLEGSDLIGCAETGTGKTAAYLLPIMHRLLESPGPRTSSRVLVLVPTRELAVQIEDDFQGMAYHTDLSVAAVYGGVAPGSQSHALAAPVDVVVATPGRLLDHLSTGGGLFGGLQYLVLDEADRLLDMGFWPSVRRIVEQLPAARQTLFFSATMGPDVWRSALSIMREPRAIQVGRAGGPASTITHRAHRVASSAEKVPWLAQFLRRQPEPTIVFVRTKRGAERLAQRLAAAGIRCVALHADRSQEQRTAAIEGFRSGRHIVLVATDVAARGLDIDGIGHVVNFEPPWNADAYVHRVGRTGRAQATGIALTLVSPDEERALHALERELEIVLSPPDATAPVEAPLAV